MPLVKVLHRLLVLGVVECAVLLVLLEGALDLGGQLRTPVIARFDPQRHAGWGVGYDEFAEALGSAYGKHGAQHAAPRLAEKVEGVLDGEMAHEVVQLGEEQLRRPEGGIEALGAQVRAAAVADLIVEDYGDRVRRRQPRQRQQVVV